MNISPLIGNEALLLRPVSLPRFPEQSKVRRMYLLPPSGPALIFTFLSEERHGVSEMAQQANALAAEPEDLSLIPGANTVGGGTDC